MLLENRDSNGIKIYIVSIFTSIIYIVYTFVSYYRIQFAFSLLELTPIKLSWGEEWVANNNLRSKLQYDNFFE